MARTGIAAPVAWLMFAAATIPTHAAEAVMVQCGHEYQAAKAAGTLNGADWNAFRQSCAARLRSPAVSAAPAVQPAAPAQPASSTTPAAPVVGVPAASGGMAAMHARQKQCGAEWRAGKAALLATTPGLTWPKYWSQCNARLKAANG